MAHFSFTLRLVLFASALAVMAHSAQPRVGRAPTIPLSFRAYGADLGLPSSSVLHLLQDRQGFIWAGTDAGLFRYDGSRFTAFGLQEGLPSSEILALHQEAGGDLWVGTRQGLVRWNGLAFDSVTQNQGLPKATITGLVSDRNNLWVGTNQGPFVRSPDGGFSKASGWTGDAVTSIFSRPGSGVVWVASWDGSTHVQSHKANGWTSIDVPAGMEKARIDGVAEDGSGRLWARAPRSLWVLDTGASRFRQVTPPVPLISDRGSLQAGSHGDIWIPTQDGLTHVEGETWTTLTTKDGLPTQWCRSVLEDREGSLWIGSTGLFRLLGRGAWHSYTQAHGLPSEIIWNIFRGQDQQLWVGTDNGLARATPKGWEVVRGTLGRGIRTVIQGADGVLYVAGVPGNEVLRYDPKRQILQRIALSRDAAPNRIFRLIQDKDGNLWASTDGAGLFQASTSERTLRFERVALPGGIPTEYVGDVHQDAAGRIWATGERGLAMLENGSWRRFTAQDGLKRDHVAFIRSRKNGDLLISYKDPLGLTQARYEAGALKILQHYDASNSLENDRVYLFGEDAKERIWVGTTTGIDMIMPEGVDHFGTAEGLVSEDCNNMAFLADTNGDVWIGTSGGLAHFDAKAYPGISAPTSMVFLHLGLGQETFRPGGAKVRVPYRSRTFETRFTCLSFLRETSVHQQVRLLGLESEWHRTNTHEARYPALPPGNYRFEVRSQMGKGAWGPTAAFEFEVLPPWYRTLWAYLLYLGLGFFTIWAGHRARTRILLERNRVLRARIGEATLELQGQAADLERMNRELRNLNEQKNQFFGIVTHDLRNPLNGIVLEAQLIDGKEDLQEIYQAARNIQREGLEMSALIGRFLDIAAIESGGIKAEKAPFDLWGLAVELVRRHMVRAQEKGIEIRMELLEGNGAAFADPKFTKEVLDNLISNAVKFSPPGKAVSVRVEGDGKKILVSVQDQGPGLTEEDKALLFERFARLSAQPTGGEKSTGLGLSIVKHMVEAMEGRIWVDSEPGRGAAFRVELRAVNALSPEGAQPLNQLPEASPMHSMERSRHPAPDKVSSGSSPVRIFRGRVLLADDNLNNRKVEEAFLKRLGLEVACVEDGVQALEALEGEPFDIVFLDGRMPRLDGAGTVSEIRRRESAGARSGGRRQVVVALTALAGSGSREGFLDLGFDELLSKPLELTALQVVLDRFLDPATEPGAPSKTRQMESWEALAEALGGPQAFAEFLAEILKDADVRLARLHSAFERMDREQIERDAHDLHSNAATLGLHTLAEVCRGLELGAPDMAPEELRARLDRLPDLLEALRSKCRKYLKI